MPRNRCACSKVKSTSMEAARLLHARVWAHRGGEPVRFYPCRHGYWHWTRQELRSTNPNKKAAA